MLTHFKVDLQCWNSIIDRFSTYVDNNLEGQSIKIIEYSSDDSKWLESCILPEVSKYFKEDPKIKICAFGGLGPKNTLRVHMDGHYPPKPDQHWALNIPIFNCDNSIMFWYDNNYEIEYSTPTNDPKLVADNAQHIRPKWIGEPKIIAKCLLNSPIIAKVTIPHSVVNTSDKPRFLLSIRFQSELFPV